MPCLNDSADVGGASSRCDVFVYPAILQAVEDVNSNGSVLRNGRRERLDFRLNLTYVVTEVAWFVVVVDVFVVVLLVFCFCCYLLLMIVLLFSFYPRAQASWVM